MRFNKFLPLREQSRLAVRIPDNMRRELDAMAREHNVPLSKIIRQLLANGIKGADE